MTEGALASARAWITAHLNRCEDGKEVWADRYDRAIEDIFEVQMDIARLVSTTVAGRIAALDSTATLTARPETLQGYALVMRGLRHMHTLAQTDLEAAVDCFSRATEADPTSARAWGLLALGRIHRKWHHDMNRDVGDAIPLAERALSLDPREARAHCALAMAALITGDFVRAAQHYRAGLEANPNDDLLLTEYGRFLMYDDRPEEGLMRIREAMRLNPYHPPWYWGMQGRCFHTLGRFAEARDAFLRFPEPPFYTYAYLAACHHALGETEAARAALETLHALRPDFDLEAWRGHFPYRNPQTAQRFLQTFQAAGLG